MIESSVFIDSNKDSKPNGFGKASTVKTGWNLDLQSVVKELEKKFRVKVILVDGYFLVDSESQITRPKVK